ncbi:MAG: SsrA-binding protein [Chloroflexi bacterium]|nr:SsrA-binding protein [Chloroflexota bacterium]
MPKKKDNKILNKTTPTIKNKRGLYNYSLVSEYEAGIVLKGGEVKAIRNSHVTIHESYAKIEHGEIWLNNLHITKPTTDTSEWDTLRQRKLLMHKKEIRRLLHEINTKPGLTLIPTRIYFKHGKIKISLGLVSGKRKYDKRQAIKKRESDRALEGTLKKSIKRFQ